MTIQNEKCGYFKRQQLNYLTYKRKNLHKKRGEIAGRIFYSWRASLKDKVKRIDNALRFLDMEIDNTKRLDESHFVMLEKLKKPLDR